MEESVENDKKGNRVKIWWRVKGIGLEKRLRKERRIRGNEWDEKR